MGLEPAVGGLGKEEHFKRIVNALWVRIVELHAFQRRQVGVIAVWWKFRRA
jgi:hypothetical protein